MKYTNLKPDFLAGLVFYITKGKKTDREKIVMELGEDIDTALDSLPEYVEVTRDNVIFKKLPYQKIQKTDIYYPQIVNDWLLSYKEEQQSIRSNCYVNIRNFLNDLSVRLQDTGFNAKSLADFIRTLYTIYVHNPKISYSGKPNFREAAHAKALIRDYSTQDLVNICVVGVATGLFEIEKIRYKSRDLYIKLKNDR